MADVLSVLTAECNTPASRAIPKSRESRNPPFLNQGFDMLIDRTGFYGTNGREEAKVFGLRGDNCIGYVIHADGKSVAAVWHSKDGTRINGPEGESLVRFVRETPARIPRVI
jgi:hypothetical protein